jgi:RNA polymerase sigma factor (sigma-70 family)
VTEARLADLEALYRRDFARFVRVATALLRDEERAVDAVQEAFATAIRERRRFRGDGSLEGWVWRIVVNAARKARPRWDDEPIGCSEATESTDDPAPVRAAIATLPERQRMTLFLRYYADLDYRSIAETLEVSPGTVAASLNAAHASLRRKLQEVRQ